MSWWATLREGRRLWPQTVADEGDDRSQLSDFARAWIEVALGGGEGTEDREAEELARLRTEPERAVGELASAYDQAPEVAYALRWALVHGIAQLRTPAGLPFLERVLKDEIPPERSQDIHHLSTVAEETSLRLQAISGIAALAADEVAEARQHLLDQLSHPSYAVRVMATQALRELPNALRVAEGELRSRLPAAEADRLLAIRRVPVEELETPIEPGRRTRTARPPGGESGGDLVGLERRRPPHAGRGKETGD